MANPDAGNMDHSAPAVFGRPEAAEFATESLSCSPARADRHPDTELMTSRAFAPAAALACGLLLASCSGGADDDASGAPPGSGEYLAGRTATVDLVAEPKAVVVLVPGGAWAQVWDPPGFRPLAEAFVDADLAVVQIAYSTAETDAFYPRPVDDIACAAAFAAEQAPGVPVVLVGHSAGAHLVALTGLAPGRDDPECPYSPHAADAVVGLAGPYDVSRAGSIAENLFGVAERRDPELWLQGNPSTWVGERLELPFLLMHGEADSQVPVWQTEHLAEALEVAGHPVTVEVLPGREHNDLYQPDVVADLIIGWIDRSLGST